MIIYAVTIVLITIIIANLGSYIYNNVYPPCDSVTEYFNSVRNLPDGATAGLGSIPSGTDMDYVGARRVETDDPNTIGLKSWNDVVSMPPDYTNASNHTDGFVAKPNNEEALGLYSSQQKNSSNLYSNAFDKNNLATAKHSDIKHKNDSDKNKSLFNAITQLFPVEQKSDTGQTKKGVSDFDNSQAALFEVEMEGLKAKNDHRNKNHTSVKPSGHISSVKKDGYSDRDPNAW